MPAPPNLIASGLLRKDGADEPTSFMTGFDTSRDGSVQCPLAIASMQIVDWTSESAGN
jgi:hypothetical protein